MKKVYIAIIFFIINISIKALNFTVSPTKFEADLKKDNIFEVYLLNNTSKPLRLEIYSEIPKGYEDKNLDENIVIYPKKISIKPGAKKEIHFKVKKKDNIKNEEHKSLLVFRESLPVIKEKDINGAEIFNLKLDFITEIAVGIYGK